MFENIILIRGIERIIIQFGGLLLIFLGVLLFKWGVSGNASLILEKKGFKFQLLNGAPGLFFALFGLVILFTGISGKLIIENDLNSLVKHQLALNQNQKEGSNIVSKFFYSDDNKSELHNFLLELKSISVKEKKVEDLKRIISAFSQRSSILLEKLKFQ